MDHVASNKGEREPKCNLKGAVLDPAGQGVADVLVTATSISFGHTYQATTDSSGEYLIEVAGPLAAQPVAFTVSIDSESEPSSQVVDVYPNCTDAVDVEALTMLTSGGRGGSGE